MTKSASNCRHRIECESVVKSSDAYDTSEKEVVL